jgi:dephospho-CoA kinase
MFSLSIGVVGPCAAGKSTLIEGMKEHGFVVKHIAQEHSYVKDMWERLTDPDVLIYLDVSYIQSKLRRDMNWTNKEFLDQVQRLRHAKANADLYIDTEDLTPQEVLNMVLNYLAAHERS